MNRLAADIDFRPLTLMLAQWRVQHLLRGAVFVAVLLLSWITLRPFEDLGSMIRDTAGGQETLTYLAFGVLAVIALLMVMQDNMRALVTVLTPGFLLLVAWISICSVLSMERSMSMRRLVLTLCVMALVPAMMLLPRSGRELMRWLSIAAIALLVVCFLGVLVAPQFATHLITDTNEAHLAGSWRGSFSHKNTAAAMMVMLIFIGIYAVRSGAWLSGSGIVVAAFVFLLNTGGKTSLGFTFLVLLVSSLTSIIRSPVLRAIMLLLPLAALNMLSIGTIMSDTLAELAQMLPLDTSFTGRTDIWNFALEHAKQRLVTGYGFGAFWLTDIVRNLPPGKEWAETTAHSHNGFLDTVLWTGLPGLLLVVVALVVVPLRNFQRAEAAGQSGPLLMLLLRLWLFGLYLSALETFFLDRADPVWVTFLLAMSGLHFLARYRLRA